MLKQPDASGRWEVSTYRWEPSQIVVNQGDDVTLEILGVNGARTRARSKGYDIGFTVKRGELTTVSSPPTRPAYSGSDAGAPAVDDG